jgi:hypothetical protein
MALNRTVLPKSVDLSGSLDGSTVTFTLSDSFISGTLEVWINGLRITPGTDFTVSGKTFTLTGEDAPASGEHMVVKYYPAAAAAPPQSDGYASTPRQVADQYGTPRILYD